MPKLSARHRSARHRIASRAAAAGAAVASALVAWPVLALDSTSTVMYSCTALGRTGSATYPVDVVLRAPAGPAAGQAVQVTWQMAAASPSGDGQALVAPTGIATSDVLVAEGLMEVTGAPLTGETGTPTPTPSDGISDTPTPTPSDGTSDTPTPTPSDGTSDTPTPTPSDGTSETSTPPFTDGPSEPSTLGESESTSPSVTDSATGVSATPGGAITLTPAGTATMASPLTSGATLSPIPDLVVTLTPTVEGTVGIAAGDFTMRLVTQGATVTPDLYTCTLPPSASRASIAMTVLASGSHTPEQTPTDSGSPTATDTSTGTSTETATASVTETVTTTVSATVSNTVSHTVSNTVTAEVSLTPLGGAQTGGGGEVGPDGRLLVLGGIALMAASASGGLLLRRFRPGASRTGG
ncbi:hypothetical protein [Microbispora sp. NPDC049125]|uniref:hypothetical protein n=1 Tax=Microbispora sp. NPDC049125 TaxID=3154929 RepID=UPI003465944D